MSKPTNEQRIVDTLRWYAADAVPDDLDPWPAMRAQITGTMPVHTQAEQLSNPRSQAVGGAANGARWRKPAALGGLMVSLAMVAALVVLVVIVSNNKTASLT